MNNFINRDSELGLSVLGDLEQKVAIQNLPVAAVCRYALFSKAGFTSELEELANRNNNIILTSGL
jgi:hypothetical protein